VPAFYTREWGRNNQSSDALVQQRTDRDAWKVTVKPYVFQTLGDIMADKTPSEHAAAACTMLPELRIKLGVVNRVTGKMSHVATLHEGLGLRTKKFYKAEPPEDSNGAYDEALGLPQNSAEEGKTWLGFSGEVDLPSSLGAGVPTHLIDVILAGSEAKDAITGAMTYSFNDIRVGPLFNLAHSGTDGHPAGSSRDLVDMLDLKLGGYKSNPSVAAQAF
jgi:hypothetical protein